MDPVLNAELTPAGLRRRLLALLYDSIALTAVLYFAAFLPVIAAGGALAPGNVLFLIYLLLVAFGYFRICWGRGATLGMQAWKLCITTTTGERPGSGDCARRFAAAALSLGCGGLGYFAALISRERLTWHDRLSGTRLWRRPR